MRADVDERNVEVQRRASAALRRGSFENLGHPSPRGLAYLRSVDGGQALVALNFGPASLRLRLRRHIDPAGWRLALSALPDRVASLARGAADLGPFQDGVFLRG